MPENAYNKALDQHIGQTGDYYFQNTGKGFINFLHPSLNTDDLTGWKTHFSVNSADVPRATDVVLDVYQKHGGKAFKVTDPDLSSRFSDPASSGGQAGKMFTLYDAGEKNWPEMITEIERGFEDAQIRPGVPVIEDKPIPGSKYAYRRNDLDRDGNYVSAKEAARINPYNTANPYGQHDPLSGFELNDVEPAHAEPKAKLSSIGKTFDAVDDHAGKAVGKAGIGLGMAQTGLALSQGDYVAAAQQGTVTAGWAASQSEVAMKQGGKLLTKGFPALARAGGEAIPIVGGVVATGFGVWDVGSTAVGAMNGENSWDKVASTAVANIAEIGGGLFGFGAGQAARQGVVELSKAAMGPEHAPSDSAVFGLAKDAYHLVDHANPYGPTMNFSAEIPQMEPDVAPEPDPAPIAPTQEPAVAPAQMAAPDIAPHMSAPRSGSHRDYSSLKQPQEPAKQNEATSILSGQSYNAFGPSRSGTTGPSSGRPRPQIGPSFN